MENVFKNAKFGDVYRLKNGELTILYKLMPEGAMLVTPTGLMGVLNNGRAYMATEDYDIDCKTLHPSYHEGYKDGKRDGVSGCADFLYDNSNNLDYIPLEGGLYTRNLVDDMRKAMEGKE